MKKYFTLVLILISFVSVNAQYTWVNKNLFPDGARYKGATFVINGMGYVVGGGSNSSLFYQNWQYNPVTDTWATKANYPHKTWGGASFVINGKGYQIGGYDTTGLYESDNNEYDPVADTWTSKSPFPEDGFAAGFYFAINGIGYVGSGIRNTDETGVVTGYSYNPTSDTWSSIANYPGNPSIGLCTFVIDSFGYAGIGGNGNNSYYNDLFQYNPATNSWLRMASFPGKGRYDDFSSFVVNGKAYVGAGQTEVTGSTTSYALSDYYVYDPTSNTWSSAPGLQGPPRHGGTAFSFGDSAYLIGGHNTDGNIYYSYVDEFRPVSTVCSSYDTIHTIVYDTTHISVTDTLFVTVNVGISPNNTTNVLEVYPNPAHNQLLINTGNYATMSAYSLKITNLLGQTVFQSLVTQQLFNINISSWATGVYFLQVLDPTSAVIETKEIVIQ